MYPNLSMSSVSIPIIDIRGTYLPVTPTVKTSCEENLTNGHKAS